jgi:hypothetical protein
MKENQAPAEMPGPGSPQILLAPAGGCQQRSVQAPAKKPTLLAPDLGASGFAVTRPDSEARAWNFRALRRFGFDSAALVFCCPAVSPKFAAGSFSAKTAGLEAAALDLPPSRRIGFDGAVLVFC